MLKIYVNANTVTAVLSDTRWDAVRCYTPKLLRKLNNQVSGCMSFGIHAPGQSMTDIKGTIFEDMEMPAKYSYVAEFNGITKTLADATAEATKAVLDLYHEDLREQKFKLIRHLANWLGEVDDALQTEAHELEDEQYYNDSSAEDIVDRLSNINDGIEKFKDGVSHMGKIINEGLEKMSKNSIYGVTNYNVDDLIKQAPKELQDEIAKASAVVSSEDVDMDDDDIEIEGDLVTPNSNFSTGEPLTDRDDDDFTPEEEEVAPPVNTASKMLDPLGLGENSDDDEVDESDPEDLL